MALNKLISSYARYNEWAINEILDWLKLKDEDILDMKVDSSFETINETLKHIFLAQKFWIAFVSEEDITKIKWNLEIKGFSEMDALLRENSNDLIVRFSSFSDADLLLELELDMSWMKNKLSRYEYMMHVINHGTYHRGQIITMGRILKIEDDIPNTDYNKFKSIQ